MVAGGYYFGWDDRQIYLDKDICFMGHGCVCIACKMLDVIWVDIGSFVINLRCNLSQGDSLIGIYQVSALNSWKLSELSDPVLDGFICP